MKNILTIIVIAIMVISCKAQSPIVALDADMSETPKGAYYKDLKKELNKFVGTWKYTNGTTSLTFLLQKKEEILISPDYYDMLVGEYKYNKSGYEIVNTLANLNTNNENMAGRGIYLPSRHPVCETCSPTERRIKMYFSDPEREYLNANVVLRYIPNSSPAKITATIYARHGAMLPNKNSPTAPRVPYGTYTLTKQ